jgi:hypothetical protein
MASAKIAVENKWPKYYRENKLSENGENGAGKKKKNAVAKCVCGRNISEI